MAVRVELKWSPHFWYGLRSCLGRRHQRVIASPEEIQTFRVISRRISCSTSVKGQTNQRHLMKTKILRNIIY